MTGLAHCPGASRPNRASSARFTSVFPERSDALNVAGSKGSVRGVPHAHVDAVANPHQDGGPALEDALESETLLGRLNLLRVAAAHGGDDLGVVDARLEEAHLVPELQPFAREHVPGQVELRQHLPAEVALVREVVNREHRSRAGERGMSPEALSQVHGHEARLPVMRVNDGRAHAGARRAFEGGSREQREPHVIVGEVAALVRVQLLSTVVRRTIHEPEAHAIVMDALEDAAVGCAEPRAAPERGHLPALRDAAIAGRDHRDAMPKVRERRRERASDVAETAGLGIRNRLGHDHENVEHLVHSRRDGARPDRGDRDGRPAASSTTEFRSTARIGGALIEETDARLTR